MKQYLRLAERIINEGHWVTNGRTGKRCLTVVNADMIYDVDLNKFPCLTTRKSYWKPAISELLGYLRGYRNASDFRAIGCNTWNSNANENEDWLRNPNRKGPDDMGRVYGVQGRNWTNSKGEKTDQLRKLCQNLENGIDDRAEIMTFYNPGEFEMGCLRPCMHTHNFTLLNGTLHLTSYQRSCDVPLGLNFNQMQCFALLYLVAQITGNKPGKVYHKIVNAHIYEDQLELMKEVQIKREPYELPKLCINPDIKTIRDIETWVDINDFEVCGYMSHAAINYPFSV